MKSNPLKSWMEQCLAEFERKHKVKLSQTEREVFLFAFAEGIKVGEDCGFLL
ncbi:hypothetical protein [Bacillus thuringiensis]|uniref:hypothetical protein n=1 Tax=Bacillus thuringiensis TaxID=1428 RepID=UPI00159670DC|nr:hypothetical protein [Bacillus thuringiensis]